jgi:hypothetical protein
MCLDITAKFCTVVYWSVSMHASPRPRSPYVCWSFKHPYSDQLWTLLVLHAMLVIYMCVYFVCSHCSAVKLRNMMPTCKTSIWNWSFLAARVATTRKTVIDALYKKHQLISNRSSFELLLIISSSTTVLNENRFGADFKTISSGSVKNHFWYFWANK